MYEERIHAYFDDSAVQEELVSAVKRLVSVRSVREEPQPGMPFGPGPAAALREALALCAELGFRVENVDNYVGVADLGDGPVGLHILGHLDVVHEGKGWTVTEPYAPKVVDGVLYGRGVADDKGPVVAALFALKAVRDLGLPLKQSVKLIMGTDEECGSSDIAYYYKDHPFAPHTFTPDADFPLINIEKGHFSPVFGAKWERSAALPRVTAMKAGIRPNVVPPEAVVELAGLDAAALEAPCAAVAAATGAGFEVSVAPAGVTLLCKGKNAHAAGPGAGINAIQAVLEVLARLPLADCGSTAALRGMHELFPFGDWLGKALGVAQSDEKSGELTLNLAMMELDEGGFTAVFDSRTPLCANEENCKAVCVANLAKHGISVQRAAMMPPHEVPGDSDFVRKLLGCYAAYTGEKDPRPIAIGGGTYVHNIPGGVAFGCEMPGSDPNMHGANEKIPVADLVLAAKIFTQAIVEVCG